MNFPSMIFRISILAILLIGTAVQGNQSYEEEIQRAVVRIQEYQRQRGNVISAEKAEKFARELVPRNVATSKAPSDRWDLEARYDILSRLQLRALRTLRLENNHGFLHEFPGNFWLLGNEEDNYLDFEALAFLLNGRSSLKLLRVLAHSNSDVLSASGPRDKIQYADLSPEALVSIWRNELHVDLDQFDAIIVGGCKSALKRNRDHHPVAKRMAVASGRPTFGSIASMTYSGSLTLYEIAGFSTVHYKVKLRVEAKGKEMGMELPTIDPWDLYFPDRTPDDVETLSTLLAELNAETPGVRTTSFNGDFVWSIPHPAPPSPPEFIESCRTLMFDQMIPLPDGIFLEL